MLKYVCASDVMDVVFSVCIVKQGAEVLVYGKCECFVMQLLYVCVCCASCDSSQCCMTCSLLMLVEDERGILQSRSHDCLVGSHESFLLLPHPVAVGAFINLLMLVCVY